MKAVKKARASRKKFLKFMPVPSQMSAFDVERVP